MLICCPLLSGVGGSAAIFVKRDHGPMGHAQEQQHALLTHLCQVQVANLLAPTGSPALKHD